MSRSSAPCSICSCEADRGPQWRCARHRGVLAERVYRFNAAATGDHDAESFFAVEESTGTIAAGVSGYTWGGCCHVSYLWVAESARGQGLGSELLRAVEHHAREKRCRAPKFYVRRGYLCVARIDDHPVGHSSSYYCKRLDP